MLRYLSQTAREDGSIYGLAYGTFAGLCKVQGFHVETGIRG